MNELTTIIKESGLEESKAKVLLDNFSSYFQLASEWEIKAKAIHVTNDGQIADMRMARIGRLELRNKRLAIENTRKQLKEQSLREGKAIDGIANVLKALIVPIEEYLERQEMFIEIQEKNRQDALRIEAEARIAAELIAKEKREAEDRERIKAENEKLRREALEREEILRQERESAAKAKAEAEAKAAEERKKTICCPNCGHKFVSE